MRPAMAILLAIALHGLIAAGLLLAPQAPVPDDAPIIDVVLASPPKSSPRSAKPPSPPPAESSASRPTTAAGALPPQADEHGAWRVQPGDAPENEGVRRSLRARVGCGSADLLALTKAERDECDRKLAAGAQDGPTYAVVSPKLKKQFDGVFECPKDDAWCEYRIGKGPYPGLFAPRKKKNPEWD